MRRNSQLRVRKVFELISLQILSVILPATKLQQKNYDIEVMLLVVESEAPELRQQATPVLLRSSAFDGSSGGLADKSS